MDPISGYLCLILSIGPSHYQFFYFDWQLCLGDYGCKCQDAANNTYTCLRTLASEEDSLYCQFDDSEDFVELYDMRRDPYQLDNKAYRRRRRRSAGRRRELLAAYYKCRGRVNCFLDPSRKTP